MPNNGRARNSSIGTRGSNKSTDCNVASKSAESEITNERSTTSKQKSVPTESNNKSKQHDKSDKQERSDIQSTLDKHWKSTSSAENNEQLDTTLKNLTEKLSELASQEYIEDMFKKLVTQEILNNKLEELQNKIKSSIANELDKVYKDIKSLRDQLKVSDENTEHLKNKISDIETKMENVTSENERMREENKRMTEQLEEREIALKHQSDEINNLKQYTRRNSVRIYGVDDKDAKETHMETANRVVKLVKEKLNITISSSDIDIAHRVGRFQDDGNRPIICKFLSRNTKLDVIKARRQLKNSAIVIREDLTIKNAKLLETTSSRENVKSAWSDGGRIIALLKSGKKISVSTNTNLDNLGD